jgi:hypothetical protein
MDRHARRFTKGTNPGTRTCYCCGKRTWAANMDTSGTDLCKWCYEEAGLENEHSDDGPDHHGKGPQQDCPLCFPTEVAARAAARNSSGGPQ